MNTDTNVNRASKKVFWTTPLFFAGLLMGLAPGAVAGADAGKVEIRVATAADMRVALGKLIDAYQAQNPGVRITPVLGASGNLTTEISSGAPYDLFFSADRGYPETLAKGGFLDGDPQIYGRGVLVLWTKKDSPLDLKKGLKALTDESVKKVAVANPAHAPFGRAAIAALKKEKVYSSVEKKLVTAENVGQAAQFALTGAADTALIALSLASEPPLADAGTWIEIPVKDYPSLDQAAAVIKKSGHLKESHAFLDFAVSETGKKILAVAGLKEQDPKEQGSKEK